MRYGIDDLQSYLQLKTYGAAAGTPFSNLQGTLQVLQVQQRWTPADRRLKQRQGSADLPDGLLQLGGFLSSSKATPLELSLQSTAPATADSDGAGAVPQPWQLSSFAGIRPQRIHPVLGLQDESVLELGNGPR